jgi:peroxiredoxin
MNHDGQPVTLSAERKPVVLAFPAAFRTCTSEICALRDAMAR